MSHPKLNQPVIGTCVFCGRAPFAGESYGPDQFQWDFSNVCWECWEETTAEPEEDDDASATERS